MMLLLTGYLLPAILVITGILIAVKADEIVVREVKVKELIYVLIAIFFPVMNIVVALLIWLDIIERSGILEKQPFKKKEPNDNTTV